jgi:hypothetical protein
MVTTTDNPFDPFDDFDRWFAFDTAAGYHTCSYLAAQTTSSPHLSEADQRQAIEIAVDEIVELNVLGIYKKVTREITTSSSFSGTNSESDESEEE